jgi:TrmH family RNA methyltransferase
LPRGAAPLVVTAVGVQDPGNLGSMVRTADAAGADAFFACGETADPYHPRAVRATMGSIFRLPPRDADPGMLIDRLRHAGIACLAADLGEGPAHHAHDLTGPTALFFGRESGGLPGEILSRLDERIRIPMRDDVDSLSVGAAAAVVLFEAARQRERF